MDSLQAAREMVHQIDALLLKIPTVDYHRPLHIFNGSTLGQHFRHILNFYECVLQAHHTDVIDYSNRNRDLKVESQPQYARTAFSHLLQALEELVVTDPIRVKCDFKVNDQRATVVVSSIGRELMYAFDHAVHHLAIIRIGLRDIGAETIMDDQLGVAPSTTRHRSTT